METTEPMMPKRNTLRAFLFLVISLVILSIVLYTAQSRGYLTTQPDNTNTSTTESTLDPALNMKLVSATGNTQFARGENVTLTLVATSSNRDIVGFDALINFDPAFFTVVSTKSHDERFQAIPFNKEGMISVTGTKSPNYNGQAVLNETEILAIVLKPKQPGTTTVSIQSSNGQEKTKMVDTSSNVHLPQLTPITLAIY